ncbi:MAG: CtsR family transcriptional regulator [Clostridia bacterium]|nr:CtsR family transcriptional regulator [Clostridia bacterium]
MRISDIIEEFIKEMLETDNSATIQRNDLAEHFNCVPSQINYVISTRFTPLHGYYVESQRGGGGYIRIHKVNVTNSDYLMHIIASIGERITAKEVDVFVNNFIDYGIISDKEAKLIKNATNDKALTIPIEIRDQLRANIFKNMIITLV